MSQENWIKLWTWRNWSGWTPRYIYLLSKCKKWRVNWNSLAAKPYLHFSTETLPLFYSVIAQPYKATIIVYLKKMRMHTYWLDMFLLKTKNRKTRENNPPLFLCGHYFKYFPAWFHFSFSLLLLMQKACQDKIRRNLGNRLVCQGARATKGSPGAIPQLNSNVFSDYRPD